jgi:hypothetical protein
VNITPVVSWVLDWDHTLGVIEPIELRNAVIAELDAARERYR